MLAQQSLVGFILLAASAAPLHSQNYTPPASQAPDEATAKAIRDRSEKLTNYISFLQKNSVRDPASTRSSDKSWTACGFNGRKNRL